LAVGVLIPFFSPTVDKGPEHVQVNCSPHFGSAWPPM